MSHSPAPWRWVIPGEMDDETMESPLIPVPWETWQAQGYFDNPQLLSANGDQIISAGSGEYCPIYGNTAEERAANARLIAASPDMYETLKAARDQLINLQPHIPQSCYPGREGFIDSHVDVALEAMNRAIAKAEGRE